MNFRVRLQLDEALGSDNRWFCSQCHGRRIDDAETLIIYFVRSGGAKNFADRFEQAMGAMNRWFCSEFYGRDIRDPEILWTYYMTYRVTKAAMPPTRENHEQQQRSQSYAMSY